MLSFEKSNPEFLLNYQLFREFKLKLWWLTGYAEKLSEKIFTKLGYLFFCAV